MQLAIAQINCTVADLSGNTDKIIACARRAQHMGASLLLTPELAISGYPPEDLLLRDDFLTACAAALARLAAAVPEMTLLVGHPARDNGLCYNAASVLQGGEIVATYYKQVLPNHSVFDEERYFAKGDAPLVFTHAGVRCGVLICADVWETGPARLAKQAGAQLLLALNASPYHQDKQVTRHEVLAQRVQETGLAVVYANMVGGQDELVFDGASFVLDRSGELMQQLPEYEEAVALVRLQQADPLPGEIGPLLPLPASVYRALCLGLHDYVSKNGFPGVVLGLSGGIDSALTLAIAVDALGADKVRVVMMPSEFTADISISDAREMAQILGVQYSEMAIKPLFELFRATLAEEFAGRPFDATEENLQARIRGMLLMALSNKFGSIVLTTGNKSEMAVGYSTLYGDMAGGFSLLKDVPKTLVYQLADYRNQIAPVIPTRIITRPPSAELRPDQTDQDSLPPYEVLDAIMEAYVEDDSSRAEIRAQGFREQDIARVTGLIDRNEYKRRQAPVGVRITHRGFGKDRRYPITYKHHFAD
ncbi:NAD+ synthase [Pseudomethylobacillus aquaticus]|uniref:Glutamine-dependent NAD(+) synthetase n=1 Tax=Pseudomethylobacillus aquaticus TaxID=2676064 RepID=A0A3N0V737_9PROT|nr:NAD+ synthase [Pseudomethylobacillus aquaticus]ROH88616.1 NAD+ synthase [Pseudomethylobacillus aquaticus]